MLKKWCEGLAKTKQTLQIEANVVLKQQDNKKKQTQCVFKNSPRIKQKRAQNRENKNQKILHKNEKQKYTKFNCCA